MSTDCTQIRVLFGICKCVGGKKSLLKSRRFKKTEWICSHHHQKVEKFKSMAQKLQSLLLCQIRIVQQLFFLALEIFLNENLCPWFEFFDYLLGTGANPLFKSSVLDLTKKQQQIPRWKINVVKIFLIKINKRAATFILLTRVVKMEN